MRVNSSSHSLWLMKTIMKNYANITAIFLMLLGTCNLTPGDTRDGDGNCVLIDGVDKRGRS